jgi:excisionase family DNA binding protein
MLRDIDAAAGRLATTKRHVRELIYTKRIDYVKVGGKVRISDEAIDAFIAENTIQRSA